MKKSAHLKSSAISHQSSEKQTGFTILELLVVMGMSLILVAIAVTALARPQAQTSVATVADTFVADLKQQQLLSMEGDSGSQANAQAHGIRVTASSYTSFTGNSFAGSSNNYTINFPQGVTANYTAFPLDIIFAKHSGETTAIANLVIKDTSGDQKTLIVNRLGGITVN
jgi:prepilin-type N-terminal cleavage/methylation domain-containing protein